MRYYDFKKAYSFIEENKERIQSASLGFNEDWFWTAETIFENGDFTKNILEADTVIGGISGSYWATPTLQVDYIDGQEEKIECSTGELPTPEAIDKGTEFISGGLGCLSKPVQEMRGDIDRKI